MCVCVCVARLYLCMSVLQLPVTIMKITCVVAHRNLLTCMNKFVQVQYYFVYMYVQSKNPTLLIDLIAVLLEGD